MKKCSKCKINKEACEFYDRPSRQCGKRSRCIKCEKEINNTEDSKKYRKEYVLKNKQRLLESKKNYVDNNRELIRKQQSASYLRQKNNNKITEYREKNKDKLLTEQREWRSQNRESFNKRHREYACKKRREDPFFRLKEDLRNRINVVFKRMAINKMVLADSLLGASIEIIKWHIEKQFKDGMSWENRGRKTWHIDHVVPLSSAKDLNDLKKLFHYTNLQPLWATENLIKGAKII